MSDVDVNTGEYMPDASKLSRNADNIVENLW
jgi:hypothetical protein